MATIAYNEEADVLVKSQFNVCQYCRSDVNNRTKYLFKCNEYRKYLLRSNEIQIIVPDYDPSSVTSVKLVADSSFFNEYSHMHLCLSSLSVRLLQLGELYLMIQSDFQCGKI